jgi:hypothetical protein
MLAPCADILEEVVNPVEEPGEPLGIKPGRDIALGKAFSECVIHLPLGTPPAVGAADAEIASVDPPEDQGAGRDQKRSADPPFIHSSNALPTPATFQSAPSGARLQPGPRTTGWNYNRLRTLQPGPNG